MFDPGTVFSSFVGALALASTLERLGAPEVANMVAFRWQVASGGASHPFSDDALLALYEHSEGIPREATILADNALLLGFYQKKATIDRQVIEDAVSAKAEK